MERPTDLRDGLRMKISHIVTRSVGVRVCHSVGWPVSRSERKSLSRKEGQTDSQRESPTFINAHMHTLTKKHTDIGAGSFWTVYFVFFLLWQKAKHQYNFKWRKSASCSCRETHLNDVSITINENRAAVTMPFVKLRREMWHDVKYVCVFF